MNTQHEHATPPNDRTHGTTPAPTVSGAHDAHDTERLLAAHISAVTDRLERCIDRLEGVTK